jgi:hypothetical protein
VIWSARRSLMGDCWAAVGGDARALQRLHVGHRDRWLGGPLPVDELALAAVAAGLLAAAELAEARGCDRSTVGLSAEHVALCFTSERHALIDGSPVAVGFAPLSRFVRCSGEGWARTHANYPHHAQALGCALGFDPASSQAVKALQVAAGALTAPELEDAVFAADGCAAAMRSPTEWSAHPAGRACTDAALVIWEDAWRTSTPRSLGETARGSEAARGIRVLDLTRVIAGPVAGRTLAALGADVLRVDPPGIPELPAQHLDTGPGKRTATLDLSEATRREALLAGADVLLSGYRPGALARFGMTAEQLAERHPHLVRVSLSAWGEEGPWGERRGFDSLVQSASGIAAICAGADETPGVLPAQALDHATGHLMAACALHALARRARGETIAPARLSLARTAAALLRAPRPDREASAATGAAAADRYRVQLGRVDLIAPPGTIDGAAPRWRYGPRPLGGDEPVWPPRSRSGHGRGTGGC